MEIVSTPTDLEIDNIKRDISLASNLPARFYTSKEIYDLELQKIFYSTWLCVCRLDGLPNPGDVLVKSIGERSILIVRGKDGTVRAFHNVCRHRGSRLYEESCNTSVLQCIYHAWTYGLDGSLIGAPEMQEAEGFDKTDYPLYSVKLEVWSGFVWVNFDPNSESLLSFLGDFPEKMAKFHLDDLHFVTRIAEYDIACNWKVWVENFNECYHCPTVHPDYDQRMSLYRSDKWNDFGHRMEKLHGPYSLSYFEGTEEAARGGHTMPPGCGVGSPPSIEGLTGVDLRRNYIPWVYPNFILSIRPDYVVQLYSWPDGPNRTKVTIDLLFPTALFERFTDPSGMGEGLKKSYNRLMGQDIRVCLLQQGGLSSGVFTPGRYSDMELKLHIFHKFIVDHLGESLVSLGL